MKKLQNNFTTHEQSKRLLELGVPMWTADCFCPTDLQHNLIEDATPTVIPYRLDTDEIEWDKVYALPCWSVGRLMEIFAICFDPDFIHFDTFANGINFLQQMMDKFETYAENMDFTKSEECYGQ